MIVSVTLLLEGKREGMCVLVGLGWKHENGDKQCYHNFYDCLSYPPSRESKNGDKQSSHCFYKDDCVNQPPSRVCVCVDLAGSVEMVINSIAIIFAIV